MIRRVHAAPRTVRPLRLLLGVLPAFSVLGACGPADDTDGREVSAEKTRVAEYLRAFLIDRDWRRWPEYFASDATINGSDLALQILRGSADGLNYSFSGLELTLTGQISEGQQVATSFVLEGLHERPFNDQPATNRRLRIDGFTFDRFENGKIVETRLFLDVWGLTQRARLAATDR
jgi:predicted ester cyclase